MSTTCETNKKRRVVKGVLAPADEIYLRGSTEMVVEKESERAWIYEPTAMVHVWELRLGADSGNDAWARVLENWRSRHDIGIESLRKWKCLNG